MIIDRIENWKNIGLIQEPVKKAFEFLENMPADIKDGRYEIQGKDIYAIVQSYQTVSRDKKQFESHRSYIDIQYVVSGKEIIEWLPVKMLDLFTDYDQKKDVSLYNLSANSSLLKMCPGMFAVFFPEDGHLPGCRFDEPADVKKVVIKVKSSIWY